MDTFRCLIELNKIVLKDFEINLQKLEDFNKLKSECEELRRDFIENNRINKDIIDKIQKENIELKTNFENIKSSEMKRLEEEYKNKIEKLINSQKEKEDTNMRLTQDNRILKTQLNILEVNQNSLKNKSKDSE